MSTFLSAGLLAALPVLFAPGQVSGPANEADPAFTPDGQLLVFARNTTLMVSHKDKQGWSMPQVAPFSGKWNDQQPTMSPDGHFLVFVSNRPIKAGDLKGPSGNLWRVERNGDTWGEPVHLPMTVNRGNSTWAPSIAGDGSLYFIERTSDKAPFRLWRSQYRAGQYETPVPQYFGDETTQDVDPAVAADESFIVFGSMRPGPNAHERLYIAFKEGKAWGKPIDLGKEVNGDGSNDTNEARLGPDGRTLYFSTERAGNQDIWSVSLAPWLGKRPAG